MLDVYKPPYSAKHSLVCMDESPEQLIETVQRIEMCPGREAREDYDGVVNIFMANAPLTGQRMVAITEYKTKKDWAKFMKRISDEMYPLAERRNAAKCNIKWRCNTKNAAQSYVNLLNETV